MLRVALICFFDIYVLTYVRRYVNIYRITYSFIRSDTQGNWESREWVNEWVKWVSVWSDDVRGLGYMDGWVGWSDGLDGWVDWMDDCFTDLLTYWLTEWLNAKDKRDNLLKNGFFNIEDEDKWYQIEEMCRHLLFTRIFSLYIYTDIQNYV